MADTNFDSVVADTFTGAFVGNVTGNVTGDVVGDVTGDVTGNVTDVPVEYAVDGAIAVSTHTAVLTKAGVNVMTLAAPATDGILIRIISATANAHTVTATTIGFNASGAAGDLATSAGNIGDNLEIYSHNGEWLVINNVGFTLS